MLLAVEAMTLGVQRMNEYAARHDHQLVLLAEDPSMYVDRGDTAIVQFPTRDRAALERYVAEHVGAIGNIFSSTDTWGVAAAELREKFGFRSRISSEKLSRMRDKKWVQQRVGGAAPQDVTYPLIIKPRGGTGSMNVSLVTNIDEHRRLVADLPDPDAYVTQPYHRGPLYSAELWSNGRIVLFFGVTNRIMTPPPLFLEHVKTFPHEHGTEWEAAVESWARRLIGELGYDLGLAHIEFIETPDGFQLVELNARMAGALITPAIDHCTNYDPYALAVADALNLDPEIPDARRVTGGHSHVSIYADRTGTLVAVEGTESLSSYPGNAAWTASKELSAAITDLASYRARIGNVHATGASPALAQDRALAASLAIRFCIE